MRNKERFKSPCCQADVVLGAGRQWWCTACFTDVPVPQPDVPVPSREALEKALRMAQYELTTLNPRLSPHYRKSVEAVLAEIAKVLP